MLLVEVAEDIASNDATWWDTNASGVWALGGVALTVVAAAVVDVFRRRHQDKREKESRLRAAYAHVIECALDFDAAHSLQNPRDKSLARMFEDMRGLYPNRESGPDEVEVYIARRVEVTSVAVQAAIAVARAESDKQMAFHLDRLSVAVRLRRGAKGLGPEWKRLGGKGLPSVPYEVEVFTDAMRKHFGGKSSGVARVAYETETETPAVPKQGSGERADEAPEDGSK